MPRVSGRAIGVDSVERTRMHYRLPGLNGQQQLFGALEYRDIALPVILISGHADNDVLKSSLAAGTVAFLLKPMAPRDLIDCVERWLRDSRSNAA